MKKFKNINHFLYLFEISYLFDCKNKHSQINTRT